MMNRQEASKKAMYDDLFFAPCAIALGAMGCGNDHKIIGVFLIIFGVFWLSARVYHLTHQKEVFGDDIGSGSGE